jgi:hypothetical protein
MLHSPPSPPRLLAGMSTISMNTNPTLRHPSTNTRNQTETPGSPLLLRYSRYNGLLGHLRAVSDR